MVFMNHMNLCKFGHTIRRYSLPHCNWCGVGCATIDKCGVSKWGQFHHHGGIRSDNLVDLAGPQLLEAPELTSLKLPSPGKRLQARRGDARSLYVLLLQMSSNVSPKDIRFTVSRCAMPPITQILAWSTGNTFTGADSLGSSQMHQSLPWSVYELR